MNKKKPLIWGICLLFSLVALPLGATTISVQIVQMDEAHGNVTDSSLLIEESIMDFMFSQGYIVSNSPVIYNKEKAQNGMIISLEDAINGSADYLAYITVYFDRKKSTAAEANLLSNIELVQWSLVKVRDRQQIDAGTEKPGQLVQIDNSERGISTFGQQLAKVINTALRKKN
ncbi:MAG: hypothetical protein J6V57_02425 [Spirochaetaceae bacterium]|nr:hypothetical protein [Spirochaetaceae bacterium]